MANRGGTERAFARYEEESYEEPGSRAGFRSSGANSRPNSNFFEIGDFKSRGVVDIAEVEETHDRKLDPKVEDIILGHLSNATGHLAWYRSCVGIPPKAPENDLHLLTSLITGELHVFDQLEFDESRAALSVIGNDGNAGGNQEAFFHYTKSQEYLLRAMICNGISEDQIDTSYIGRVFAAIARDLIDPAIISSRGARENAEAAEGTKAVTLKIKRDIEITAEMGVPINFPN